MNALLWSWSLAGLVLLSIIANGVMGFGEMGLFNNGTKVFQKEGESGVADGLMVGLTLVQAAAAKGAGKSLSFFFFFHSFRFR